MAEKPKGSNAIGCLMILALMGSCVVLWPEPRERTEAEKAADKLLMARIRCENATKDSLADPDGFEAQPYGEWLAQPENDGNKITLTFRARARNGFGALVWADFTCVATYDMAAERWRVDDLTLR
jgi:hypothetical protein